jgi:sterol desaturase/sphingolipid hydroxylase (fatty acid hydroxylase superfamily)
MSLIIYASIPFFVVTMLLEWAWARRADKARVVGYTGVDTAASLSMGIANLAVSALTKAATFGIMVWLYQHRFFTVGHAWWAWLLLLFAEDFFYYWAHRASHEVRFFWAAHVNHHSSEHYNLSTALRQSWTTPFTFPIFWMPLPLLGFDPLMILTQQAISLLYQYWLHTEAIGKLPRWFEAVMNTPSHHRVHHGANAEYLDKNHAGIFIIWDRLFGTFTPEATRVKYGLTKNITTHNPLRIAFHEWRALGRDVWHAPSLRAALGYAFGPPGWRHDGSGDTTAAVRART